VVRPWRAERGRIASVVVTAAAADLLVITAALVVITAAALVVIFPTTAALEAVMVMVMMIVMIIVIMVSTVMVIPTMPAPATAPAVASTPSISAPIPARTMPAIVEPTVVPSLPPIALDLHNGTHAIAVARTLLGELIGAASVLAPINPALPESAVAPVNATPTLRMVGIASSLVFPRYQFCAEGKEKPGWR
jgi:hypothetical protein